MAALCLFSLGMNADDGSTTETPVTLQGTGTSNDPYLLSTKAEWEAFAKKVNGGETGACAVMTADIDLGEGLYEGMIGSSDKQQYSGTFDGRGHTLNVNYTANAQDCVAPFRWVSGATIKNLNTTGTFKVATRCAAGIVARARTKPFTIERCNSSVNIISTFNGDGTHGGIIADGGTGATATIKDCTFSGSISSTQTTNCGGIAGWLHANNNTISNCLVAGTFNLNTTSGSCTFSRNQKNVTITNCYYLNALGTAQGSAVTKMQLKSGDVLAKLQGERTDSAYWGQVIGNDSVPTFYNETKTANPNYVYFNKDKGSMYAKHYTFADEAPGLDFYTDSFTCKDNRKFAGTESETSLYTVCVPITINPTNNGVTLYELSGISSDSKTVNFRQVSSAEPGKPYLLEVAGKDSVELFNGISGKVSGKGPQKSTAGNVSLNGTYSHLGNDSLALLNGYIMQSDKLWHKVETGNDAFLDPTRAYLTIDGAAGAKSLGLSFTNSDGTATSISQIATIDRDGTTKYYDLNGRCIGTSLDGAPRGLYINNKGKKVTK